MQTPFGPLEGKDLRYAEDLYYFFYDMVNDGQTKDYPDARNLYADPILFYDQQTGRLGG